MAYGFPNEDGVTVIAVLPGKKWLPASREDLEGSFFAFVRALPEAPPIDSAQRITKITGAVNYPLHSRKPSAPGVALIGDAALTGDPLWGVGCGWALESAQWLAEAVAAAATGHGSLRAYERRRRRALRGHQYLAADFAKARPFNPMERLMFSAAARDASLARHMHLFGSRLIGPLSFLNPVAVAVATATATATAVNLSTAARVRPHPRARPARSPDRAPLPSVPFPPPRPATPEAWAADAVALGLLRVTDWRTCGRLHYSGVRSSLLQADM
ncbi:hypothetical protein ACFWFZ_17655 [Streptomyces sp. NPDC060232]|uniref:hypothetical protein n=1 Tax=Streptomyces sp. NPDC060232 TaxID=3347079 RepID=UPI0036568939